MMEERIWNNNEEYVGLEVFLLSDFLKVQQYISWRTVVREIIFLSSFHILQTILNRFTEPLLVDCAWLLAVTPL